MSVLFDTKSLINYSTASEMARQYQERTARIRELIIEIGEHTDTLREVFMASSSYAFDLSLKCSHNGTTKNFNAKDAEEVLDSMRRHAWKCLIDKLGIRKLMSSKRQEALDKQLSGDRPRWDEPVEPLPEINEETIMAVLNGFCQSADEFLEEAIREEYDWLKPWRSDTYKTNVGNDFKLGKKLIKEYVVERCYSGDGYQVKYDRRRHIDNIDNIFRMLDGKGPREHHTSNLQAAISSTPAGVGETEYFAFKCFKKGTIHITFKRPDLVDLFNQWCGRNRLSGVA